MHLLLQDPASVAAVTHEQESWNVAFNTQIEFSYTALYG
jgi:hypothetical protein